MASEPQNDEREFRLEGPGLVVLGAFFLAALAGAFFLGRWWERGAQPAATPIGAAATEDALRNVIPAEEPVDLEASATYFDGVRDSAQQLEPQRQVTPPSVVPSAADEAPPVAATPAAEQHGPDAAPPAEDGTYFVQVFAGRDRVAAEKMVARLQGDGARVRLFSESEGRSSLFKVRVGGYVTQDAARLVAQDLQKKGYSGAWVTSVE